MSRVLTELRAVALPLLIAVLAVAIPLNVGNAAWLSVFAFAGISALVAIGLNVLTGYTGQISLGQAAFVGLGSYTAVVLGSRWHLPLLVWLLGSALAGGLLGALSGPLALRIRGPYLIFVSLALISLGQYVFTTWSSVTGGTAGITSVLPLRIGSVDFGGLTVGGEHYSSTQSIIVLTWLVAAVAVLVDSHLSRGRVGRALKAVRDNEVLASSLGIRAARCKIFAFAVGGALAATAGALYAAQSGYVTPGDFGLQQSVQYLIVLVVGGIGTQAGPVLGALVLGAIPQLLTQYAGSLPYVASASAVGSTHFTISVDQLSDVIYGLLLVGVLLLAPRGLATLWQRPAHATTSARTLLDRWRPRPSSTAPPGTAPPGTAPPGRQLDDRPSGATKSA